MKKQKKTIKEGESSYVPQTISWTGELPENNSVDIDKEIEVWAGYWAFFNGLSKERAKKLARDIKRLLRRINQKQAKWLKENL